MYLNHRMRYTERILAALCVDYVWVGYVACYYDQLTGKITDLGNLINTGLLSLY